MMPINESTALAGMALEEIAARGGLRSPASRTIENAKRAVAEGDFVVACMTMRDDVSVHYEVSIDSPSFRVVIWVREVVFGATPGTQAGGHAFRVAAQDQDLVSQAAWTWAQAVRS